MGSTSVENRFVHSAGKKTESDMDSMSSEQAAELLRLALPLMSRHKVPVTPQNYAVWYSYVASEKPELTAEIDRLVKEGSPFSDSVNSRLYRQFVADRGLGNIEEVRDDLHRVLTEVGTSLSEAGNDAQAYEGTLGGFVSEVAGTHDLRDLTGLLQHVVEATRSMQTVTRDRQINFESKSREIEELQEQLRHERKRAVTDPLTGLYNRFALIDQMHAAMNGMDAAEPPSLIMFDIDHFKVINDAHGHLIGDRVIRFVAQTLQNNIKGKDTAARYGGEEFTVLLPATPARGAESVAETIRKSVAAAQLVRADSKKPLGQITISAGIATYRAGEEISDFIDRADQALYRSKREGRNRVSVA